MFRRYPVLERFLTGLLVITFVASFLAYLTVQITADYLVNDRFYAKALEENHIYDRVYSELLGDPAFRAVTVQLLGNLSIDRQYSQDTYGQVVAALRFVLPPETLRAALETAIQELAAYLAGDRTWLHANLNLSAAINDPELDQKIIMGVQAIQTELFAFALARGLLAENDVTKLTVQELYAYLEHYVQELAAGRVEALPTDLVLIPISSLSTAQKQQIATILLAPVADQVSEAKRLQLEAALEDNDLAGAIIIASGELVSLQVGNAVANMRQELGGGTLRGIQAFASLADATTDDMVGELNAARELAQFFQNDLKPPVLVAMLSSLLGLALLHRRSPARVLGLLSLSLVLSGSLAVVCWEIARPNLDVPYEEFTPGGFKDNTLPPALRNMLDDVLNSLLDEIGVGVWQRSAVVLALGVLLLLIGLVPAFVKLPASRLRPLAARPHYALIVVAFAIESGLVIGTDWLLNPPSAATAAELCNGYAELCDRRFDEVVFAAAHNAMAASNLGWIWPHHDGDITMQLEAGVRALLIDTHYGDTPEKIDSYLADFPDSTRILMGQIVDRADSQLKGSGVFLCHNLCSLGGTPLVTAFEQIRGFMEGHQREVVVLLIQDQVTAEDTARALAESGLDRYIYTYQPGTPWPTLGEMIEHDERLVIFAESGGPPPAWYHHLWDYAEETLYTYQSPDFFDCVPNRGGTGRPLFLLNHWIARRAPDRVDAAFVNDYEFLLARARACTEQRGHLPNFIAVDFYSIGDLFDVVDTLNGVS